MICRQHLRICSFPLSVQRDFYDMAFRCAFYLHSLQSRIGAVQNVTGVAVSDVTKVFSANFPYELFEGITDRLHSRQITRSASINIIGFLYFYWLFTIQLLVHRECVFNINSTTLLGASISCNLICNVFCQQKPSMHQFMYRSIICATKGRKKSCQRQINQEIKTSAPEGVRRPSDSQF